MSRQSRQSTVAALDPQTSGTAGAFAVPGPLFVFSVILRWGSADRMLGASSDKIGEAQQVDLDLDQRAETELQDVQALADDLHRRCDALQAEVEYLRAPWPQKDQPVELDPATVKSGIEDPQVPSGPRMESA
eukprot:Skav217572  [mRNA]  locus=scaffold129:74522:78989:- [translate_table: standard]